MEAVTSLGSIMGLAFISGIRLYSTVLALGLGIRFGFLQVPAPLAQLQVLASTPILVIAGVVYAAEFLADKIPWVDSAWDAVHTFIRPLGAAIVGVTALGPVSPGVKLGAFLLCGTIGLSSYSAKAGTRLVANHSPEPFTNIGLSLGEDALIVGGSWLALTHPVVTLILVLSGVAIIIWLVPRIFRLFKRNFAKMAAFVRRQSQLPVRG